MKRVCIGLYCLLALHSLWATESHDLYVNDTQALVLDFRTVVKYVDFGNGHLQGHTLSSGRQLSLQSISPDWEETTLSVVTADGRYQAFQVHYAVQLPALVWSEVSPVMPPDTVGFSSLKTSHFISSHKITDIVLGSEQLIAETVEQIDNIVKAKSLNEDFPLTSLSLLDEMGQIHAFVVRPARKGDVYDISLSEGKTAVAQFNEAPVSELRLSQVGADILKRPALLNNVGVNHQKMSFSLTGVYSWNGLLAFSLQLCNNRSIDYEVDFVKVYVQDKKRGKTTAMQEEEIVPEYIYRPEAHKTLLLPGESTVTQVWFFKRFTLPPHRILYFEVFEKNGGRNLRFSVSDKQVLRAEALPLSIP